VLLCFIKPILGNRYVRSRGFIVSEPRETHPRSEIADVPTLPCHWVIEFRMLKISQQKAAKNYLERIFFKNGSRKRTPPCSRWFIVHGCVCCPDHAWICVHWRRLGQQSNPVGALIVAQCGVKACAEFSRCSKSSGTGRSTTAVCQIVKGQTATASLAHVEETASQLDYLWCSQRCLCIAYTLCRPLPSVHTLNTTNTTGPHLFPDQEELQWPC